jgi:hypothetical protein
MRWRKPKEPACSCKLCQAPDGTIYLDGLAGITYLKHGGRWFPGFTRYDLDNKKAGQPHHWTTS